MPKYLGTSSNIPHGRCIIYVLFGCHKLHFWNVSIECLRGGPALNDEPSSPFLVSYSSLIDLCTFWALTCFGLEGQLQILSSDIGTTPVLRTVSLKMCLHPRVGLIQERFVNEWTPLSHILFDLCSAGFLNNTKLYWKRCPFGATLSPGMTIIVESPFL